MLIEVDWKKASRLVSSSRGDARRSRSFRRKLSQKPVRRTNASRRQGAQDCETIRVVVSLRQERQEQLGEHKTFHKASRWGYSRWTCSVRSARERETTRTGSTRHADRSINQCEHVCVEKCPLTTRHTAIRGDSCGNECRTHSQTELRRDLGSPGTGRRASSSTSRTSPV